MDKQALGRKRDDAIQTIVAALTKLGGGAEVPPFSPPGMARRYDSEHNMVITLETLAEYAGHLADAAAPQTAAILDYDDYSVSGLRKLVVGRGLETPEGATRADLIALLETG